MSDSSAVKIMARPKTAPINKKLINVGKYELTGKLLGKGNFARVEEAVHKLLKVKVSAQNYYLTRNGLPKMNQTDQSY